MADNTENVEERVKKIVAELSITHDQDELEMADTLDETIGLSPFDIGDIVADSEEEFGIEISALQQDGLQTVQDLVDIVKAGGALGEAEPRA